jgi:drug/metabolite transporter (DMT)-like permease
MRLNRGRIALVLTAVIWGSALVVTKSLLQEMGPFTAGVLRFCVAWVILAPFAFRQGYRLSLAVRPAFLLFGLTGIALYTAMTNAGLVFTSASGAALVQASIPAVTTLLSVLLLKERVSRWQLLGIGLSIAGLLFVTGISLNREGSAPLVGNLLVFGGVVAWAVYTVQGKQLVSTFPWLVITTASISAGVIFLLPFAIGELWLHGMPHVRGDGLVQLLYLGGASSALGYGLWNYGLRFLDASEAAPYINLIPVVGLLLSVLVLHEPLNLVQAAGGALTLWGVWLSQRGQLPTADSVHRQQGDLASSLKEEEASLTGPE